MVGITCCWKINAGGPAFWITAARLSGSMFYRFGLIIGVPEVTSDMLLTPKICETSHVIANLVLAAWALMPR